MASKILIVDDEKDFVKFLKLNLELAGYDVVAAYDGVEALDKVNKERPDIMILDIAIPKMDGYEIYKAVRAGKECSDIPIIMLTSHHEYSDINKGMDLGAVSYIAKPFKLDALLGIIEGFIK